jgi:hypothetical protein
LPYISRLCPSRHLIELGAIKPSIARNERKIITTIILISVMTKTLRA